MSADWWTAAADLLLGAMCPGCDAPGWGVCKVCRGALGTDAYLTRPDPCPSGFPVTATSGPYDEVLRRLISAHKERQVLALTPFLADRLTLSVRWLLRVGLGTDGPAEPQPVLVVPMPSAPAAVRRRGLDATWAMARRVAAEPSLAGRAEARRMLRLARRVRDQAGLPAAERMQNLAGSLRVSEASAADGRPVVLVDDVVTTGASLTEAARALRAAGVRVLGAATIAATVRSQPSPRPAGERDHQEGRT